MKKIHEMSCYGCRFALKARDHVRHGEQVRCAFAEKEFGGERWVNVRKGKTGDILKSKCGAFQPFHGDDSTAPEPKEKAPKLLRTCDTCRGRGQVTVKFMSGNEEMKCHKCQGKGKIPSDNN